MLIARMSSHPWRDDFLLYRRNAYDPRLTQSILSSTYNKVSRRGASLRIHHHFPSYDILHIALICIFKKGRCSNGEEEVVNGRLTEWYMALGFWYALQSHQSKTSVATVGHRGSQQGILWGYASIYLALGLSPHLG